MTVYVPSGRLPNSYLPELSVVVVPTSAPTADVIVILALGSLLLVMLLVTVPVTLCIDITGSSYVSPCFKSTMVSPVTCTTLFTNILSSCPAAVPALFTCHTASISYVPGTTYLYSYDVPLP